MPIGEIYYALNGEWLNGPASRPALSSSLIILWQAILWREAEL